MEIGFFMTLRKKIVLSFLNKMEPIYASDLCWQLRPFIPLHQIRITDTALIFPETRSLIINLKETYPELDKEPAPRNIIRFDEVIGYREKDGCMEIFLKTGYVHILSAIFPDRKYINVYPEKIYPNASRFRLFMWKWRGNLELFWWKIKEWSRKDIF